MAKWQKTPHQKLLRARERGSGVKLSAADVFELVEMDTAIRDAAKNDDEDQKRAESNIHAKQETP